VRQNLAWAAGYNALCVPLAVVGWLPPWLAGLGMAAQLAGGGLNAARLARAPARRGLMDILFLLIPLSVVLVLLILGALWWAVWRGQFEDVEAEGERILDGD
jgi:cbb3-type cytochrome oxidase maturation protein